MITADRKFKIFYEYIPMLITGIGAFTTAIIYQQPVLKVLPIFITLFVMLFNSRANRIGFILGGCNCFLYFISFMMQQLYTTAFSSAFNGIISIISFFMWKRRAYGKSTIFRKLKTPVRIVFCLAFMIVWAITTYTTKVNGGEQPLLDSFSGIIGFVVPVLTMLAFIEALPLDLAGNFISLVMFILLVFESPANLPFLFVNLYNMYMGTKRAITWIKKYKEQKEKNLTT
jgi:nicotinamide mononucleotide transporter PnuC